MENKTINIALNVGSTAEIQIHESLDLVKKVFDKDLLGVYLYGSSILGGLLKYSDIDLFVVLNRASTMAEKSNLAKSLLKISGIYMKEEKRPIEITIVNKSQVNPWSYPPKFDFQYGEWLRKEFEQENIEPWPNKEMPDLALLITQILLASKTLLGENSNQLLCQIPYKDFISATRDSLPSLESELDSDVRNVLLTLARIWCTVATNTIRSKPDAAGWVIDRLPAKYHPVLKRARAICNGAETERWEDVEELIRPCADFMLSKAKEEIAKDLASDNINKSISLA